VTEYLYPESPDDLSVSAWEKYPGGESGKWSCIDETQGSPDDANYVRATARSYENDGTIQDTNIGDSDTINWVKYWFRGQESGGEPITVGVFDGTNYDTTNLTAASWTAMSNQMNAAPDGGLWTKAKINALRWYVKSIKDGADTGVEWRVSQFYLEVDYSPRRIIIIE
jgi:hypothetical protein